MLDEAVAVIKRLLDCCELNMDDMEENTRDAVVAAQAFVLYVREHYDPARTVEAVAIRDDSNEATVAILNSRRNDKVTCTQDLKTAIVEAVSEWITHTQEGMAAWRESSGDFNVGDLVQHDNDETLTPFLMKHGVEALRITIGTSDCRGGIGWWTYDMVLVTDEVRETLEDEEAADDE